MLFLELSRTSMGCRRSTPSMVGTSNTPNPLSSNHASAIKKRGEPTRVNE